MIFLKNKWILIFLILLVAFVLRLYKLDEIPPGVNRDEASIGYTAYSILKTGKDEYGKAYPLSFQSFGDWKLPLYIYLTIPFIQLFGLTEFAVRLPSVIAGAMTVLVVYFLLKELFKETKNYSFGIGHSTFSIPLVASLLLAISPWHIHFSRVASEANLATLIFSIAVLLLLKSRLKPKLYIVSFTLFALTYYTYHGNHIFTTLFILGLLVYKWKQLIKERYAVIGLGIFVILSTIILRQTLLSSDTTKFSGIGIFGDPTVVHTSIELPRLEHLNDNSAGVTRLLHNRIIFAIEKISQNYLQAFSPDFLFLRGGTNHAHNIPNFGNMYLVEAPFLLLGLVYLLSKYNNSNSRLLLWWLFISPVAASITKDAPHSARTFMITPVLTIIVAFGIYYFFLLAKKFQKNHVSHNIILLSIMFFYSINFTIYLDRYYVHFPVIDAEYWGVGYKDLAAFLSDNQHKDSQVIMEEPQQSPYIFLLFYLRYDPALYQMQARRYPPTSDAFLHVVSFGRFEFRTIDWSVDPGISNTILITRPDQFPNITEIQSKRSNISYRNRILFTLYNN